MGQNSSKPPPSSTQHVFTRYSNPLRVLNKMLTYFSESPVNFSPDLINALQASPEVRFYGLRLTQSLHSPKLGANSVISRPIVPAVKISSYTYNNASILSLRALMPSIQSDLPSYRTRFRPHQIRPPNQFIQIPEPRTSLPHLAGLITRPLLKGTSCETSAGKAFRRKSTC